MLIQKYLSVHNNKSELYLNHLKKVFNNTRIKKYSNLNEKNLIIKSYAKKFNTVIDLGCGSLNHANSLAKLKNIKFIEAVDNNNYSSNFINNKNKIHFSKKNLNNKFTSIKRKYDLVLAISIIQFLKNHKKFLKNVKNIMKKKSILILTFPNVFFDLFSLNERTFLFYQRYFNSSDNFLKKLRKRKIKKNKFSIYSNYKNFKTVNIFDLIKDINNQGLNILEIKFFKIHKNLPSRNKPDVFYKEIQIKKMQIWKKILCSSSIMLICNYDTKRKQNKKRLFF